MKITINEFLELDIGREDIRPEHEYFVDKIQCMAGNTKILQSNEIKKHRWEMTTNGKTIRQAFTIVSILSGMGDYWSFDYTANSAKGQKAEYSNPDEPIYVDGPFGGAVRLNDSDLTLKVYLEPNHLISFYRQDSDVDPTFYHFLTDGEDRVWIDGEEADEEDLLFHEFEDWFEVNTADNEVLFDKKASDIGEVYVMTGVVYNQDLFSAQDIYEMGKLPIDPPTIKVEGSFLKEEYMICRCEVHNKEYLSIGNTANVDFTLEEDL